MHTKKIFILLLLVFSAFYITGCEKKIGSVEDVNKASETMKKDVKKYLLSVNFNYSDEKYTINASFNSNVDISKDKNYFKGIIKCNEIQYETMGYYTNEYLIIQDRNNKNVKINIPILQTKDLNFSEITPIENRAGEDKLKYYNVKINNKYDGRIGIGKDDNVIYSTDIDFRNTKENQLIAVYEINSTISDNKKEIPIIENENIDYEFNNIFDFFDSIKNN